MAQVKISALTAADPLTGVEEAPFVQGGATKKATTEQIREYVASQPNVFSVTQRIEDAAPALQFSENDTVDQNWEFIGVSGALRLDELNDAFSTTGTHHAFTHGGGTQFGSPTGGDKGAGAVNATGLFENGESALIENTSGAVIQQAFASTGAAVSTTSAIPYDDTIPQDTEGAEALSIAFTPKRSDSRIRIRAVLQLRGGSKGQVATATLVRGGVSDALSVAAFHTSEDDTVPAAATAIFSLPVVADIESPGITSQTLSARFGDAGGATIYLNANSVGSRRYGGAYASTLEIVEYMP